MTAPATDLVDRALPGEPAKSIGGLGGANRRCRTCDVKWSSIALGSTCWMCGDEPEPEPQTDIPEGYGAWAEAYAAAFGVDLP